MNLTFTLSGWSDYQWFQEHDRKLVKRINQLIQDVLRTPFGGIGKPEPLRGDLSGCWSRRINDEHREAISFLMPEFQQARTLARLLQLEARLAIAEGRHADAVASIRDGFQLAADVDRSMPILITNLIGLAVTSMMRDCVTDLIAAEGSPNLYWALQSLPPRMFDFAASMDLELAWPLRFLPFLRDAETAERSAEEWSRLLIDGVRDVQEVDRPSRLPSEEASVANRLTAAGLVLKRYSFANRELLAAGFDAQRLERIPAAQVVAIFAARCLPPADGRVHQNGKRYLLRK